jgi:ribulose-5-phosphate 4-epimerase/fuculose-1-phosphate aldolase
MTQLSVAVSGRINPNRVEGMREPSVSDTRIELAALLRACVLHGYHEGIDNHISAQMPGQPTRFLLNPYGPHWSEVTASSLVEIDTTSTNAPEELGVELTALRIHLAAHQAGAKVVIHTHQPYATALALTQGGLDTRLSQNSMRLHDRIAWLDYGGRAEDDEEGKRIAKAVSDGVRVVLMANHGVLVVAETIEHAWYDLYFLEQAARVQILAASTGDALRRVDQKTARLTARQFDEERRHADLVFAAVRRQLDRTMPGYEQ